MSKNWCPTAKAVKHEDRIAAQVALADAVRRRQNVSSVYQCGHCHKWHVR